MGPGDLVVSPCSNPELPLEDALRAYGSLGYTQFEAFSSWTASALEPAKGVAHYKNLASRHGMRFRSYHLPPVETGGEAGIAHAIKHARFAAELGVEVVLFKAVSRACYIEAAHPFLDALEAEGIPVTPVLQNHAGSPISSLSDFQEVLDGIADARMKALLEVGHFHSAGVPWVEAYAVLKPLIALVHVKDQIGAQSVPFGQGEIDLDALFTTLRGDGYPGAWVIEMEVADPENTLKYLGEAREYVLTRSLL